MAKKSGWAPFPFPDKGYQFSASSIKKSWDRLHKGDCEPFPKDAAALDAWLAFIRRGAD